MSSPSPTALGSGARRRAAVLSPVMALLVAGPLACAHQAPQPAAIQVVERLADERLKQEVDRLRADLAQAEAVMQGLESGMKGMHTRAEAVSLIAESRILVDRASHVAPWNTAAISEAREKLKEADSGIRAGHFGSSVFFSSRARRIAETLIREGKRVATTPGVRFIRTQRANIRSGPSKTHGVIAVVSRDTPVFPEGTEGDWSHVRISEGKDGWIWGALLKEAP
jgi:hypothetical protein